MKMIFDFPDGEPIKLPESLESLPKSDHFPSQRHRWNTNEVSVSVNNHPMPSHCQCNNAKEIYLHNICCATTTTNIDVEWKKTVTEVNS